MPAGAHYLVGLDLGQSSDPSALIIAEQRLPPEPTKQHKSRLVRDPDGYDALVQFNYHIVQAKRWQLGTPYPTVVDETDKLLKRAPLRGHHELLVDYTGVGRPVVDYMRVQSMAPIPVLFSGGERPGGDPRAGFVVPKRELVYALVFAFQLGRLKVADGLPHWEQLEKELDRFRMKQKKQTGTDTYEAWRDRDHDDLLLAMAMCVWYGDCFNRHTGQTVGVAGSQGLLNRMPARGIRL